MPRLLDGRVPYGDDRVAGELDDGSTVREDDWHDGAEVTIEHEDRLLWRSTLGERRVALNIREERCHVVVLAAERGAPRRGGKRARYWWCEVARGHAQD